MSPSEHNDMTAESVSVEIKTAKAPAGTIKFYLITLAVSLCFTVAAGLFRTLAYAYQYDAVIEHFKNGSLFITLMTVALAVALLSPLFFIVKFCRTVNFAAPVAGIAPPTYTTAKVFISSLCGFLFAALGVMQLIDAFTFGDTSKLELIRYILSIPASAYFFVHASGIDKSNPTLTLLGFITDVYFIVSLMSVYFSNEHALNSPQKILSQVVFVTVMLFIIAECRFPIGRASMPRYYFYGCAAICALTLTWLPQIYSAVTGTAIYDFDLLETSLYLVLTLYTALNLILSSRTLTAGTPSSEKLK